MRWQELFADLEGQVQAWDQADLDAEVADRSRAEQAMVGLVGRLAAACDSRLALRVAGAGEVRGRLVTVGSDWLLLLSDDTEYLVWLDALHGVLDLDRRAAAPEARSSVMARLGVVGPLRAIVRDRSTVRIVLRDGQPVTGTPERVGEDHVDVLVHDVGETARPSGRARLTVPFSAIALIRTVPSGWG